MKKFRSIATVLFLSLILGGMTSCEVSRHTENGRHRGWFHQRERHEDHPKAVIIIDNDNDHR